MGKWGNRMNWLEQWMWNTKPSEDVYRGRNYWQSGRVVTCMSSAREPEGRNIRALVRGSRPYPVRIALNDAEETVESYHCACPRFVDTGFCKHIAAVLFKDISGSQKQTSQEKPRYTDGTRFLRSYLERTPAIREEAPVRLLPRLGRIYSGYPEVELMIGRDKLYVVKDIRELLPTLSGETLPKLTEYAGFQDPDGILEQYRPESCVPCYYFDWSEESGLGCSLRFRYAERELTEVLSGEDLLEPLSREELLELMQV